MRLWKSGTAIRRPGEGQNRKELDGERGAGVGVEKELGTASMQEA
jgi:hypothetical protein